MKSKSSCFKFGTVLFIGFSLLLTGQSSRQPYKPNEEVEWQLTYELLKDMKNMPKPKLGFVPDARTASAIGEAVALALYGDNSLRERPFRARLRGSVWTAMGTMKPPGALGGVAIIQIQKEDGRVILAIHTQ